MRNPAFAITGWLFALAIFIYAGYWSIRFAVADSLYRENTLESVRESVALAPGNASYHGLLAEHMEGMGLNPETEMIQAATLSPLDASHWIRLGFRAESEHQYDQAEQYLLRAASVSRKFDPSWALLSFYYRRGRTPEFWHWTERALSIGYGDYTPIFQLAWDVASDPAEIPKHLPRNAGFQAAYLWFLVANKRDEPSIPVASQIASAASTEGESAALLAWWDLAHQTHPAAALEVWNTLCTRKVLPFSPLHPAEGKIVTNGDFALAPTPRGFDWRLTPAEGASVEPDTQAHELIVRLSGKEPEDLVLAEEWLPVQPGSHYLITWDYRSPAGDSVSGLNWTVTAGKGLAGPVDFAPAADWKTGELLLPAGDNQTVLLRLHYKRPLGSTRAEGTVAIRNLTAKLVK